MVGTLRDEGLEIRDGTKFYGRGDIGTKVEYG